MSLAAHLIRKALRTFDVKTSRSFVENFAAPEAIAGVRTDSELSLSFLLKRDPTYQISLLGEIGQQAVLPSLEK
ncbi:hypothetical protein ABE501_18795 [Comamonas testosteroni]